MNIQQAFGNMVAVAQVAQEAGKLTLDQAVAVVESIKVVRDALGIQPQEAAPPKAEG